jgi:hypothetical protein
MSEAFRPRFRRGGDESAGAHAGWAFDDEMRNDGLH